MKKVCILGHFAFGQNLLNGQTVKTKIVSDELDKIFPDNVVKIDTCGGIKTLVKAPFHVFKALKSSENVVIFPAHRGLRVYAPLLAFMKPLFSKRKLHYAVIGGWLAGFLDKKPILRRSLKKFHGIYVETSTMKRAMENLGFENIIIMPNCKELPILSQDALVSPSSEPYRLCTFSRVMKEKGIEDAVNAVKHANSAAGRTVYTLDIYGQIDAGQAEWFAELQKSFPEYVKYGGLVQFDKSVEALKDYFALLFPTRFYTEGIPGTIIDAYAAGVPVISAKWESFSDIVDDGVTGIGYTLGKADELNGLLADSTALVSRINSMRCACIEKATLYLPKTAISVLTERM